MRFYENNDVDFYVDIPNKWELYCGHPPKKKWSYKNQEPYKTVNYYRDIEGARITEMTEKDLYLGQKPASRINEWACLPIYYANGERFIKLEKAYPNGFKCAEFPTNVREMRSRRDQVHREAAAEKKDLLWQKRLDKECNKAKKQATPKKSRG